MNAVAQFNQHAVSAYTGGQLDLIRKTVAKDCTPPEFDLFVSVAQRARLDPLRKQISAIVFNKDKADKRQMAIVTGIDGLRSIADRSGQYSPDDEEPDYVFDDTAKGPLNPVGLVKAKVKIFKRGKPVIGVAYWEEFAPIKDEWAENDAGKWRKTGAQTLDTSGNWARMPRLMLAKCAEAQALRKAFPEDLSGLYEYAEMDKVQVIDLLPSEVIEKTQAEDRLTRIGIANAITLQLSPTSPLEAIPLGKMADTIMGAARDMDLNQIRWFESANTHPLREFWARSPSDALAVKKALEKRRHDLELEAATAQ